MIYLPSMAPSVFILIGIACYLGILSSGTARAYRLVETRPSSPATVLTTLDPNVVMPVETQIKNEETLATIGEVEGVMDMTTEISEETPVLQTQVE